MENLQKRQPEHVNLTAKAIKEHVPAVGDIYAKRDAYYGGIMRITGIEHRYGKNGEDWGLEYACEELDPETLAIIDKEAISESSLKSYYRYMSIESSRTYDLARAVMAGDASGVAKMITGEDKADEASLSDETALVKGRTKKEVETMLAEAEEKQNALEEVRLWAKHIMESRRRAVEKMIDDMDEVLGVFKKKVDGLIKVITIMNLYLGREVDVQQIADGPDADPSEKLHIRQRILFMDEELCAHIDHEADYNDIDLFFKWVTEPANRNIIIPEQRCVVALKPKRFNMDYRSGDAYYDAQRDLWNKHTYLLIRNGGKLWVMDDSDLECWDWVFPHSDFEEAFQASRKESFYESRLKAHENAKYRVMRFSMFIQGLIDRGEIFGKIDSEPNLIKGKDVVLVRDDEKAIGTGIKPWADFVKEKNALIRRGNRIIYAGGRDYWTGGYGKGTHETYGGDFARYYAYESSKPAFPGDGLYHVEIDDQHRKPYFLYNPGGTVWPKSIWEKEHERKRREAWYYDSNHVINYDAITTKELQTYFDDRTLRQEFRDMMPLLKKALLQKREEEKAEAGFKLLMTTSLMGHRRKTHHADHIRALVDEAVEWWKGKVIYTRPLTSDDAKAWRMIKKYCEDKLNTQDSRESQ